jgi:hypothetical protein
LEWICLSLLGFLDLFVSVIVSVVLIKKKKKRKKKRDEVTRRTTGGTSSTDLDHATTGSDCIYVEDA